MPGLAERHLIVLAILPERGREVASAMKEEGEGRTAGRAHR